MRNALLLVVMSVLGLGVSATKASALGAASKIRNPSAPLTSLHAEALIPILSQMQLSYEGVTLPNGQKALLVEAPDGAQFQVTPMACDAGGRCRGMHLVAMFQTDVDRRTVMAFNDRYAFVSAGLSRENLAYLSRYEIADYGLPRGNIAVSIDVFLETSRLFTEHLTRPARQLVQAPEAGDLSANGLNLQSLMTSVGLHSQGNVYDQPSRRVTVGSHVHAHGLSFEATNDVVETFLRAEAYFPGRIVNHVGDK